MINLQKDLLNFTALELELTKLEMKTEQYQKIRGVNALWNELEETAYLIFYYDGEITETDIEMASDICAYIISHLTRGELKEQYIRLDYPKPLPKNDFWGYKRIEN